MLRNPTYLVPRCLPQARLTPLPPERPVATDHYESNATAHTARSRLAARVKLGAKDTNSQYGASFASQPETNGNQMTIDIPPKPPSLPLYSYQDFSPIATTVYTRHEEEANDLIGALNGPLGFDMEWRVNFHARAPERRTALVQLSDERIILLVQISAMRRFPEKLKEIIESKDTVKMGVNIANDGRKLFRDFGILARNLVELGGVARQADPDFVRAFGSNRSMVSLAKVVERYCGKKLVKGKERTGNWEAELGPNMINYAANDAHCALMVYKRLLSLAAFRGKVLTPAEYTTAIRIPNSIPTQSSTANSLETTQKALTQPQHARAYRFWHYDKLPLQRICAKLRSEQEPLKESTVISYVIKALESDRSLPFDLDRLKALVQMEAGSWQRHRDWILEAEMNQRYAITCTILL